MMKSVSLIFQLWDRCIKHYPWNSRPHNCTRSIGRGQYIASFFFGSWNDM